MVDTRARQTTVLMSRTTWLWPAILTLLVTLYQVDRAQLWRDELATWSGATRSPGQLLRMAGNIDAISSPYYLFMHFWIRIFGDSVLALRLPSVLAMAGSAALTAVAGERLFGGRAGLLAGLMFAVVPSTSRYAQETRPYAFATLLAILSTLLLIRAVDRPAWARWLGYGAAIVGLGLAHLIAVTILAGHAVAVLLAWRADRDRRLWRWAVAVLPAVLALAPLALLGVGQRNRQLDWVSTPTLWELPGLPGSVFQTASVGGAMVALAAVGCAAMGRWGIALGASVLLPAAVLFVAGLITPLWVPRYLVFTVPFVCLLAAAALTPLHVGGALAVVAIVGLLGAPAQAALRRTHEWPRSQPVDYAAAARIIATETKPGDGIVYSPRDSWKFLDTAVAYHLRDNRPRDVLGVRDQVQRASLWAAECDQPARCLASADRVWLLVTGAKTDPLKDVADPKGGALRAAYSVDQVWTPPGLTVALLTRHAD